MIFMACFSAFVVLLTVFMEDEPDAEANECQKWCEEYHPRLTFEECSKKQVGNFLLSYAEIWKIYRAGRGKTIYSATSFVHFTQKAQVAGGRARVTKNLF